MEERAEGQSWRRLGLQDAAAAAVFDLRRDHHGQQLPLNSDGRKDAQGLLRTLHPLSGLRRAAYCVLTAARLAQEAQPQKMCSICGGGIEPGTKYMMIAVGNPRKSQKHEPAHPQCAFDLQSKMGR